MPDGSAVSTLRSIVRGADGGESPRSKSCPAIDGIIKEADELMKDYKGQPALDAGLLAGAQAAEHYERSPAMARCATGRCASACGAPPDCWTAPLARKKKPIST